MRICSSARSRPHWRELSASCTPTVIMWIIIIVISRHVNNHHIISRHVSYQLVQTQALLVLTDLSSRQLLACVPQRTSLSWTRQAILALVPRVHPSTYSYNILVVKPVFPMTWCGLQIVPKPGTAPASRGPPQLCRLCLTAPVSNMILVLLSTIITVGVVII